MEGSFPIDQLQRNSILRRWNVAGIVFSEPSLEIIGKSGVELFVFLRLKNVHIEVITILCHIQQPISRGEPIRSLSLSPICLTSKSIRSTEEAKAGTAVVLVALSLSNFTVPVYIEYLLD